MKKDTQFKGQLWVILDENGQLLDDIDTDMIFHNAHLAVTDINEMGQYAFGNLQGWTDFSKRVQPGDIVLCGKNFGSGSSRQHAVDCFTALGVKALIAESFGAIYKRNAINAGFPILTCPGLTEMVSSGKLTGEKRQVVLDLDTVALTDSATGEALLADLAFNKVQMDIYLAGNIFEFGRTVG